MPDRNGMRGRPFQYGAARRGLNRMNMKTFLAVAAATLIVATFTLDAASARHRYRGHYHYHHHHPYMSYGRTGGYWGNAAMSGNNGNSGSGSNSLGHIKGGNIGGGK